MRAQDSRESRLRPDGCVDGDGLGWGVRRWEADMIAAAAAGAAAAEEGGSSGETLISRMALEALGLLVEGLAGQQVIFGGGEVGPFLFRGCTRSSSVGGQADVVCW